MNFYVFHIVRHKKLKSLVWEAGLKKFLKATQQPKVLRNNLFFLKEIYPYLKDFLPVRNYT